MRAAAPAQWRPTCAAVWLAAGSRPFSRAPYGTGGAAPDYNVITVTGGRGRRERAPTARQRQQLLPTARDLRRRRDALVIRDPRAVQCNPTAHGSPDQHSVTASARTGQLVGRYQFVFVTFPPTPSSPCPRVRIAISSCCDVMHTCDRVFSFVDQHGI